MHRYLVATAMVTAAFLQACTGGRLTDGNGHAIIDGAHDPNSGIALANFRVNFSNVSTGKTYSTGLDSHALFSFDGYAPGSAANNDVYVPEGTYNVSVTYLDPSFPFGFTESTPYKVNHTYNNDNCPDHLLNDGTRENCALYQVQLLGPVDYEPAAPYSSSYLGYRTTVVPLKLYIPKVGAGG
jgi:hypothetical protein